MNVLINMFLLAVYFPYITVFKNMDTQPTALMLGSILFLIYFRIKNRINKLILLILILSFLPVFFLKKDNLIMSVRGVLNYWSLGIISYVSYELFKKNKIKIKMIKKVINLWFILGFIQITYSKNFLNFLIQGMRTSENRGVTSFAPEPTFYGIVCIFLGILVIEVFEKKERKIYFLNLLIQMFFFSKSSMTILFLLIGLFIYLLKNFSWKLIFTSIGLLVGGHLLIVNFLKESRVYILYNKSSDIKQLFFEDHSLNMRLSHIFYSIKGAVENFLFPNGLIKWIEYISNQSLEKNYFHTLSPTTSSRIMSGFGGIIYEYGAVGIIYIFIIIISFRKGLKNKEISIFLLIISFSAIQPAFPLNGFILGMAFYNLDKRRKNIG
ncbi:MAG: hypothetical protein ACRC7N_01125 [Clostridium sp.]